jgi:hypothetical protein
MSVCYLSYPACNAHGTYCHLWPVRLYHIFPHYLIKGTILEKKRVIEHKICVLIFSTTSVRSISHSKKKCTTYCHMCTLVFTWSTRYFHIHFIPSKYNRLIKILVTESLIFIYTACFGRETTIIRSTRNYKCKIRNVPLVRSGISLCWHYCIKQGKSVKYNIGHLILYYILHFHLFTYNIGHLILYYILHFYLFTYNIGHLILYYILHFYLFTYNIGHLILNYILHFYLLTYYTGHLMLYCITFYTFTYLHII